MPGGQKSFCSLYPAQAASLLHLQLCCEAQRLLLLGVPLNLGLLQHGVLSGLPFVLHLWQGADVS